MDANSPPPPINTPLLQNQQPQSRNILIVEDEPFIGELYARSLKKAGHTVKVLADGALGLREARTNAYDVILLDIMVPNVTGTELLHQLRDPGQPKLKAKIIVTTNLEQNEKARQAVEKQADGYLIKANITPRELVKFLDSVA